MGPETQRKIEETVMEILKKADMDEMTEFKVRTAAAERLGMDLSDTDHKRLVRHVVESFLVFVEEDKVQGTVATLIALEQPKDVVEEKEEERHVAKPNVAVKEVNDDGDRVICRLSNKRIVSIQDFRGRTLVSIREYYERDGKQLPSSKGISLSTEQWSAFRKSVPAIEEAIMKMESRLRSELVGKQNEDMSNSMTAFTPHGLVPIETTRLYGKNYHCWVQQMELFLKQLKIAYVLTDPCPSVTLSPETSVEEIAQAKAAVQKWGDDDYICRHNILNSLSDHLFDQYSKKTKSAKELWEELKLVYFPEEYGSKRSQVTKYIEFQMVDGKSILEQVQELNKISDSIIAAGMWIDENFHVSTIISKLPPSWKDYVMKLMNDEYLPLWMLMDRLRVEEEFRNRDTIGEPSTKAHPVDFQLPKYLGLKTRDMKNPVVCYTCGKKGHISRHCYSRKFDKDIIKEKRDEGNVFVPVVTEINMVGGIVE